MTDLTEQKQRLYARRREVFGEAAALYDCCFGKDNGQVPQLEQARRYLEHWEQMRQENMGLLLWGPPGSGKTFAAACIANGLLEQETVFPPKILMTTFGTILNKLPAMTAEDKNFYLSQLLNCDLLILDDFGMERQTDYAREQVFHVIDGRYLARKPLIVTTNLSLNDLKNTTDLSAKRIYDRVLELCIPVCFHGDSLRTAKAAEKMKQFRCITGQ